MNQQELKDSVSYNPETGQFIWLVSKKGPGAKAGQPAGGIKTLGYVMVKINQVTYAAHRLAWLYMTGDWPKDQIDHINRCRHDNRWSNLREATNKENHENLPVLRTNTSGHPWVRWEAKRGRWYAYITHNGRMKNLGRFDSLTAAIEARAAAERSMFTHTVAA